MAMYENIAAGVVYLVPSPRMMAHWAHGQPQEETGGHTFAFPADSPCPRRGAAAYRPPVCSNWPHADDPDFPWHLVEWYHADFSDVIITWDSWDDLKAKLIGIVVTITIIIAALLIWYIRIEADRGSVRDELLGRRAATLS